MLTLKNTHLEIQIQDPGSSYKRSRFDWSGICQQITLEGAQGGHIFCSQEATDDDPGTEGIGLTDEFGIATPIGYDQIEVGEWFPKIGIGFLQKTNTGPYDFMLDYPMRIMPIAVDQNVGDQISFIQKSDIIAGWGWILRKAFSLEGPTLTIEYALVNIGKMPITTEQYNHNFLAIDRRTVGPDYQMQTSFPLKFEALDGGIKVEDKTFYLTEIPPAYIYALQLDCNGLQNVSWSLIHQPSGHGLRVNENFPLYRLAVWAKRHVISPEFFAWIDLQPGETQIWKRTYNFF